MPKLDSENFNNDLRLKYLFILHQLCLIQNRMYVGCEGILFEVAFY